MKKTTIFFLACGLSLAFVGPRAFCASKYHLPPTHKKISYQNLFHSKLVTIKQKSFNLLSQEPVLHSFVRRRSNQLEVLSQNGEEILIYDLKEKKLNSRRVDLKKTTEVKNYAKGRRRFLHPRGFLEWSSKSLNYRESLRGRSLWTLDFSELPVNLLQLRGRPSLVAWSQWPAKAYFVQHDLSRFIEVDLEQKSTPVEILSCDRHRFVLVENIAGSSFRLSFFKHSFNPIAVFEFSQKLSLSPIELSAIEARNCKDFVVAGNFGFARFLLQ